MIDPTLRIVILLVVGFASITIAVIGALDKHAGWVGRYIVPGIMTAGGLFSIGLMFKI